MSRRGLVVFVKVSLDLVSVWGNVIDFVIFRLFDVGLVIYCLLDEVV